jgi:hypothetical protein
VKPRERLDRVKPQTIEHLDILHVLGVSHAIFVITKIDLTTPARVADVEEEIRIVTAGTVHGGAPIVGFSATAGEGLDTLRLGILRDHEQKAADRIIGLLEANPLSPPTLAQIENETGIGRATLIGVHANTRAHPCSRPRERRPVLLVRQHRRSDTHASRRTVRRRPDHVRYVQGTFQYHQEVRRPAARVPGSRGQRRPRR